ncbi:MAG TPA: Gfo/Idh/MocA family oxidoreductase [Polyangiaceae bacterium]|jgi:predicted dehydrogenase|nr:Gfo/Idh/MocA family oxidoreductase [Polyangiaceae bacterium]
MTELNVAMIGYQFMGKAHSNAWRQVGHFFDLPLTPVLKVLCGRDENALSKAAGVLGFREHDTDWQRVVARKDIDIVDICTPGDSHRDIALAAAAAGKVVFCEKPLANTLSEAEEMLGAVERAGVLHMLCHNYRRLPAVMRARELIFAGALGKIHHFRGCYLQDWIADPSFPRVWRLERKKAGSGALGDIGSHVLDLARFLVGEISEVAGMLHTFVKQRPLPGTSTLAPVDVDDAALALLRFNNGAIGSLEASRFATGRKNHNRFEINGEKGSLVFDLERLNELELYLEEGKDSGFRRILITDPGHPYVGAWWPPGHLIGYEHSFTHTVLDLVRAIESQSLPTPNFKDGVQNQRLLEAIERSSERAFSAV